MFPTRSETRRGFTLIELLVVIAIIAILAAILFPVFAQAREKARQTACLSNHKQIMLAMLQYSQDFDEMLPRLQTGPSHWDGNVNSDDQIFGMENALDPYIKAPTMWGDQHPGGIWQCPDDFITRDDCDGRGGEGVGFPISYEFPHFDGRASRATVAFGPFATREGTDSKTLAALGQPAGTIVMYEFFGADLYSRGRAGWRFNDAEIAWGGPLGWTDFPATINIGSICDGIPWLYTMGSHNGIMNVSFMDGHAKGIRRLTTIAGVNQSNGRWDGVSKPNMLHWDEQFH